MRTIVVRYDKNENVIAIGENFHDLARILRITPQAVSHGIHRNSKLYAIIEEGGEDNISDNLDN